MPLSILFWVVYIIAILFGMYANYEAGQPLWYRRAGAYFTIWVLLGILGWEVFGAVVKR
jgi:hypothetical protein